MTDRINLPIDPCAWPGTPEYEEIAAMRRERAEEIRLRAYEDELDRTYLRR